MTPPSYKDDRASNLDFLSFTTVKINGHTLNGEERTGTGFFFLFENEGEEPLLTIITNRHVVDDIVSASITMNLQDNNGQPLLTEHYSFNFYDKLWFNHPNNDVDLCALPIDNLFKSHREMSIANVYHQAFTEKDLPRQEEVEKFRALEDIVMVGYSDGLFDALNNRPVLRRGITATSVKIDYEGRAEFLIDSAVFPGSSGSPVVLHDTSPYLVHSRLFAGKRMMLLGVAYSVFLHDAMGEIIRTPISKLPLSVITGIPNHLGAVIRYDKILDFKALLKGYRNSSEPYLR